MSYNALFAGTCAATASVLGKLSGNYDWDTPITVTVKILLIVGMVGFNACVWTFFVKALQASTSSLPATLLSSATNYFISAIAGYFFFGEVTSLLWWAGTFLVLTGIILICKSQKDDHRLKET